MEEEVREGAREGVVDGVFPPIPCTNQFEYF